MSTVGVAVGGHGHHLQHEFPVLAGKWVWVAWGSSDMGTISVKPEFFPHAPRHTLFTPGRGRRARQPLAPNAPTGPTLQRLLPYLWQYKWRVVAALAFMVAAKVANVGVPVLLKQLVDAMSVPAGSAQALLVGARGPAAGLRWFAPVQQPVHRTARAGVRQGHRRGHTQHRAAGVRATCTP